MPEQLTPVRRCLGCGYALHGLPEESEMRTCPECGRENPAAVCSVDRVWPVRFACMAPALLSFSFFAIARQSEGIWFTFPGFSVLGAAAAAFAPRLLIPVGATQRRKDAVWVWTTLGVIAALLAPAAGLVAHVALELVKYGW
jgi:hypothetical protein